MLAALPSHEFETVLVDDLSRLARDNYLMLSILAEFHFEASRVISVADGLDSNDEESTLGIQIRGIFNELQLRDLKKKLPDMRAYARHLGAIVRPLCEHVFPVDSDGYEERV